MPSAFSAAAIRRVLMPSAYIRKIRRTTSASSSWTRYSYPITGPVPGGSPGLSACTGRVRYPYGAPPAW
jgi:hypothetical protein